MPNVIQQIVEGQDAAARLGTLADAHVYPRSIHPLEESALFLVQRNGRRLLALLSGQPDSRGLALEMRELEHDGQTLWLGLGKLSHDNAARVRALLPTTAPTRVGLRTAAGLGDRLGLATPGHIRAMRHTTEVVPVLAQQSIREMERTGRSPQEVLDDATWGVLQEGWRQPWGADADHLMTAHDIDACLAAGFVMYTLDPRAHVDNAAETDDIATLRAKYEALPWERLDSTAEATYAVYVGQTWYLDVSHRLAMSDTGLLRAACKYGTALAHIRELYEHLRDAAGDRPWELEISVDETDTPTRPEEHLYIALELRRLGVEWVSLAPRYIGRFEKGVDYIGDLQTFEEDWRWHVAIARALGPYKLSLHSGSDKFSIYPIAARHAGDLVHLKTAGTSYLEALRAVARIDPPLFREILTFAATHYETERRSYHVSGELAHLPDPDTLPDAQLEQQLDHFDTRQVLHVTFGVVLNATDSDGRPLFRERLYDLLSRHEETHYAMLEKHLARHVTPFEA